jgi:Flp pilus assembly protein TadB
MRRIAKWERSMDETSERPVVTQANKEKVRAGSTGHHLRYMLIASCALVIIAFIAVALFVRP